MPSLFRAVVVLCLSAAVADAAEPRWSRVDTPNFVVIGTGSEKQLQTVGGQFEGFREALTQLLSPSATAGAVPTIVIAFPDDKTFKPFKPVYEGKIVEVGGLFVPRRDVNYILLGPVIEPDSLRSVFHEYAHLIVSNVAPTIPVWLNEGLAEYYSSFELGVDRRQVVTGRPILHHLRAINEEPLIPLNELIATTHDSPQYNENSRRSLFYAEVWALVHMLLHGEPDRRPALSAYVNDVSAGTPPDVAWRKHFDGDLSAALRQYARKQVILARQFTLPEKIARTPGTSVAWSPAGAEAVLGGLLLDLNRPDAAGLRFEAALGRDGKSALAALGAARARNQPAPAVAMADEDWLTNYLIGVALLEAGSATGPAAVNARNALQRAIAQRPDLSNALVRYAEAIESTDVDPALAIAALQKAHAAAPVRDDYTFALARALWRAGDTAGARAALGGIIARPRSPQAREQAFEMMRRIVAAARATNESSGASGAPSSSAAGSDSPGSRPSGAQLPDSVERPVFREVKAGETRSEGQLERIECSAAGATLSVRIGGELARFVAAGLPGIEFITYRSDLNGGVQCGPRTPPEPVYVTWVKGERANTVVAVEFLPKRQP